MVQMAGRGNRRKGTSEATSYNTVMDKTTDFENFLKENENNNADLPWIHQYFKAILALANDVRPAKKSLQ